MNQQKLQMFMLYLRSIYASMMFICPLMLNNVGSETQAHLLLRFGVYRDQYLSKNPKIISSVSRGDTHP